MLGANLTWHWFSGIGPSLSFLPPSSSPTPSAAHPSSMVGPPYLSLKDRYKTILKPTKSKGPPAGGRSQVMVCHSASLRAILSSDESYFNSPRYASSSAGASSPTTSVRTPDPPSSPCIESHVSSSPKSFWAVAFNYGPGIPFRKRTSCNTSPTDTEFSTDKFLSSRRSSSESAPPLMSDADVSEYSEDIDVLTAEDDSPDAFDPVHDEPAIRDEERFGFRHLQAMESEHSHIVAEPIKEPIKGRDGEMDIASVLLDLSRQVRIAKSDLSSTANTAIPTITEQSCSQKQEFHESQPSIIVTPACPPTPDVHDEINLMVKAEEDTLSVQMLHQEDQVSSLSNLDKDLVSHKSNNHVPWISV